MKLLVVEDNKKLARFLVRAFAEEGYVVDLVGDGAAAVQQIQVIPYDLVILDWMLPEMNGLAVCQRVRDSGNHVPILMLTARADVPERVAGLDGGADDYLAKPFDLGELMARARALLRRTVGDQIVRVGALVVQRSERRATLDGVRLDLTPREFMLLSYLVSEVGRDVPRMEILAKVWETAFDPGSNVVDVHVKSLRDKLGSHGRMIETVRGVGYKITASDEIG